MKVSIIIPTYKRCHLLKWNLTSLARQEFPFEFETIVLNDGILDETEQLVSQYKEKLNMKYIFTGQRNLNGKMIWRVPGYTINIGVKHSQGDIIILCCAEIFHLNDTIKKLVSIYDNPNSDKFISMPIAKDDNGSFLKHLEVHNGNFNMDNYNSQPPLINVKFPFFIAMKKHEFMSIGGYDEDFTGTDYDDEDLIMRMLDNGCSHIETDAVAIHLWHPRLSMTNERIPRFEHNKRLFEQRRGIILRNENREWGKL
jgi:glycosyltransferase involved in cell wall biosynthesis